MTIFLKKYINLNNFYDKLFIIFLLICVAIIRLSGLDNNELNSDEYWHLFVANQSSVIDVLKAVGIYEIHMPLSYVIWYCMLKISDNQMWLRMSSFIPYLLLILSSHQFCKAFFNNRNLGLVLATMLTFAVGMTSISIVIRYYSLSILLIFWIIIFNCWFDKKSKQKYLIYYFIASLFLVLLNQFASIIILCCGLAMLLKSLQNKKLFWSILIGHFVLFFILLLQTYLINLEAITDKLYKNNTDDLPVFITAFVNSPNLFIKFFFGDANEIQNYFLFTLIYIFYFLTFYFISIFFIIRKNYFYLNIWFFSLFYIIFCSYFIDISFLFLFRRSIFLIIVFIIIAIFPIKLFFETNYFNDNSKKILNITKIILLAISLYLFYQNINNSYFRNINFVNEEFESKEASQKFDDILKSNYQDDNNLVVISNNRMWKYLYNKSVKLEKINNNLGVLKFPNEKYVYVSYVNGRYLKYLVKDFDLKLFFDDIKKYAEKNKKYDQYKNIVLVELCKNNYNCVNVYNDYEENKKLNNSMKLLVNYNELILKTNQFDYKSQTFKFDQILFFVKFDKNFLINYLNHEQEK